MSLSKCDNPKCQGHLGKFNDCLAETLYTLDMYSGADETTGSTEAYGYYTLLIFNEDEKIDKDPALDYPLDTVPKGYYLLMSNDQGFVHLATYPTEAEARAVFDDAAAQYSTWLDENEC